MHKKQDTSKTSNYLGTKVHVNTVNKDMIVQGGLHMVTYLHLWCNPAAVFGKCVNLVKELPLLFFWLQCILPPTAWECVLTSYSHRQLCYHVFIREDELAALKIEKKIQIVAGDKLNFYPGPETILD